MFFFFGGQLGIDVPLGTGRQGPGAGFEVIARSAFHRDRFVVNRDDVTFRVAEVNPLEDPFRYEPLGLLGRMPHLVFEMKVILVFQLAEVVFLLAGELLQDIMELCIRGLLQCQAVEMVHLQFVPNRLPDNLYLLGLSSLVALDDFVFATAQEASAVRNDETR